MPPRKQRTNSPNRYYVLPVLEYRPIPLTTLIITNCHKALSKSSVRVEKENFCHTPLKILHLHKAKSQTEPRECSGVTAITHVEVVGNPSWSFVPPTKKRKKERSTFKSKWCHWLAACRQFLKKFTSEQEHQFCILEAAHGFLCNIKHISPESLQWYFSNRASASPGNCERLKAAGRSHLVVSF